MKFANIVENIDKVKVLVFGDFMVDKYIIGTVERISPEAPVPILKMENKELRLGGAGNLINNLISLNAQVRAIGCVGDDEEGKFIKQAFKENGVDETYFLLDKNVKTINKIRIGTKSQQFIRVDEEEFFEYSKEYISFLKDNIKKLFQDINVVVISDYGKSNNEEIIKCLIEYANKNNIVSIVDPKGKDYRKYRGVTICTPNVKELEVATNENIIIDEDINRLCFKLIENNKIENVILTRSEKGISVIGKKTERIDIPVEKKEVIDVSGAGDTVVAMLAIGQALRMNLQENCRLANIAASKVCSKYGTATCTWDELELDNKKSKIVLLEELKMIVKMLKSNNKKIVFTNGCYDLLHIGHLDSLNKAKSFGDILIVAVNSDESVKTYKGENRPIIDENSRSELIASLKIVDYVIIMRENNPINIIKEIKPDISVKGSDWKDKYVPEKEVVESYGGKMEFVDFKHNISTTKIIEKVKNNEKK